LSGPLERRLVPDDAPEANEVRTLVTLLAERLQDRAPELNRSMNQAIERAIEDLHDSEMASMLQASVEGNIATILHMLRNDIPLGNMQPITAASEYAVRLARAGIPGTALRRAYHIGSDDLLAEAFEEIQRMDAQSDIKLRLLHHLAGWMHRYVDWITGVVLDVHEAERQAVLDQNATHVSQLVQRVLAREKVDSEHFAATTDYRLDQAHVAAVMWVAGVNQAADQIGALRTFASKLAEAVGSDREPLFTPIDRNTARVWCGLGRGTVVDTEQVRQVFASTSSLRVALGAPAAGVSGFRRTLEQAGAVRVLASTSSSQAARVVSYGDDGTATVAMLARDLVGARRWVREVLGGLAADDENAERLRETVRVFLRTGSYVETSQQMMLHRNTVKYRIAKAEQERGRALADGQLDLGLALHACQLLDSAVLARSDSIVKGAPSGSSQ
jgi:DNA-binding PucR family transcriptional regulator